MPLLDDIKPEFVAKIKQLSLKHGLSLIDKVRKEQNPLQLKSLLTEAHFGLYFDTIAQNLKYNNKITDSKLTPDYIFKMNSQEIIAEVCHIYPAQKDMDLQKKEDLVIAEYKKKNPDIPVMPIVHSITWQPDKLYGQNGSISLKANKYGPLVEQINKPIILCIYLEFTSALDPLDLNHSLYGHPAEYIGEFEFGDYSPFCKFHNLNTGLFYNNEQMRKNISGVLLRDNNGTFIYYHNFSSTNRLSLQNVTFFLNFQHPYK